jgi:hypothetical protein
MLNSKSKRAFVEKCSENLKKYGFKEEIRLSLKYIFFGSFLCFDLHSVVINLKLEPYEYYPRSDLFL